MLQSPVRNTFRARSIVDLQTPDGFLNLLMVGLLVIADRRQKVGPQLRVNHLNNCRGPTDRSPAETESPD